MTDLAYLEFKTDSQGTITGIVATTVSSDFYSNGKEEVVVYDIDISSNPSEIVKPTAYADQGTDGADTAKIKNAFDFFSNPTTNFSIDVTEHSSDLNMSLSYEGIYEKIKEFITIIAIMICLEVDSLREIIGFMGMSWTPRVRLELNLLVLVDTSVMLQPSISHQIVSL